jgi:hypothetical protein
MKIFIPTYDEWEGISDEVIEKVRYYSFRCHLLYFDGDEIPPSCQLVQCPHHVCWEGIGWKFSETEVTRSFYNCMCMLREKTLNLREISEMSNTSFQNVQQTERRALGKLKLHRLTQELEPESGKEVEPPKKYAKLMQGYGKISF